MSTQPQPQPEAKPTLLVVDDDPLITDTLAFALGADYEVLACDSRRHAVELVRQLPQAPALALVDLGLPPTPHAPDEGFQLIADLLAHAPGMKIFVLSGVVWFFIALGLTFSDYLTRPWLPQSSGWQDNPMRADRGLPDPVPHEGHGPRGVEH